MITLPDALVARIPVIRIQDNDPMNINTLMQNLKSHCKFTNVHDLEATGFDDNFMRGLHQPSLIVVRGELAITPAVYNKMRLSQSCLVLLGDGDRSPLVFECGAYYPTPGDLAQALHIGVGLAMPTANFAANSLRGLTCLQAEQVCRLSLAKAGNQGLTHELLTAVRAEVLGAIEGVEVMVRKASFYQPDAGLLEWLNWAVVAQSNTRFYHLRPRGLLLHGKPGTGKTEAANYVANCFNMPLVRLNLPAMLNKWLGEAERALSNALSSVETLAPCVMLLDEADKVITTASGSGEETSRRMLSKLLWWLSNHQAPVLTVMTANDLAHFPVELHRDGRLDATVEVHELKTTAELDAFVDGVKKCYQGTMALPPIDFGQAPYNQARVTRLIERAIVHQN